MVEILRRRRKGALDVLNFTTGKNLCGQINVEEM